MRSVKNLTYRSGFTLVEVLVTIALFAIFTLTLGQLLMGGMKTFRRGQALSSIRNELKTSVEMISAELRGADSTMLYAPDPNVDGYSHKESLSFGRWYNNPANAQSTDTIETVHYKLNVADGTLTRQDSRDEIEVVVAENIVMGSGLGGVGEDSPSYFCLVRNYNEDADRGIPHHIVGVRLTGRKYVGTDEVRLTVSTETALRSGYQDADASSDGVGVEGSSTSTNGVRADYVPLLQAASLEEPLRRAFRR